MPSRPHSPAPLGALQPHKPATHAAASAPDHHRHAARLSGEAAASLRTISANIYIYIRGKSSRWGRRSAAPRQATPRTSTRLGRVAGAQTRWRKRGKSRHDRGGGHSRRCRHPKPPGINPAQQNAGLARQTPKNQQHHAPSAAPFSSKYSKYINK